jgi:hypothetical protein
VEIGNGWDHCLEKEIKFELAGIYKLYKIKVTDNVVLFTGQPGRPGLPGSAGK